MISSNSFSLEFLGWFVHIIFNPIFCGNCKFDIFTFPFSHNLIKFSPAFPIEVEGAISLANQEASLLFQNQLATSVNYKPRQTGATLAINRLLSSSTSLFFLGLMRTRFTGGVTVWLGGSLLRGYIHKL